jgi:hypothetical protein
MLLGLAFSNILSKLLLALRLNLLSYIYSEVESKSKVYCVEQNQIRENFSINSQGTSKSSHKSENDILESSLYKDHISNYEEDNDYLYSENESSDESHSNELKYEEKNYIVDKLEKINPVRVFDRNFNNLQINVEEIDDSSSDQSFCPKKTYSPERLKVKEKISLDESLIKSEPKRSSMVNSNLANDNIFKNKKQKLTKKKNHRPTIINSKKKKQPSTNRDTIVNTLKSNADTNKNSVKEKKNKQIKVVKSGVVTSSKQTKLDKSYKTANVNIGCNLYNSPFNIANTSKNNSIQNLASSDSNYSFLTSSSSLCPEVNTNYLINRNHSQFEQNSNLHDNNNNYYNFIPCQPNLSLENNLFHTGYHYLTNSNNVNSFHISFNNNNNFNGSNLTSSNSSNSQCLNQLALGSSLNLENNFSTILSTGSNKATHLQEISYNSSSNYEQSKTLSGIICLAHENQSTIIQNRVINNFTKDIYVAPQNASHLYNQSSLSNHPTLNGFNSNYFSSTSISPSTTSASSITPTSSQININASPTSNESHSSSSSLPVLSNMAYLPHDRVAIQQDQSEKNSSSKKFNLFCHNIYLL